MNRRGCLARRDESPTESKGPTEKANAKEKGGSTLPDISWRKLGVIWRLGCRESSNQGWMTNWIERPPGCLKDRKAPYVYIKQNCQC